MHLPLQLQHGRSLCLSTEALCAGQKDHHCHLRPAAGLCHRGSSVCWRWAFRLNTRALFFALSMFYSSVMYVMISVAVLFVQTWTFKNSHILHLTLGFFQLVLEGMPGMATYLKSWLSHLDWQPGLLSMRVKANHSGLIVLWWFLLRRRKDKQVLPFFSRKMHQWCNAGNHWSHPQTF